MPRDIDRDAHEDTFAAAKHSEKFEYECEDCGQTFEAYEEEIRRSGGAICTECRPHHP